MATDLQAYLASKYMSGPKAEAILAAKTKKKSKKKGKPNESSQQPTASYSGMILKDVDGQDEWDSRDDEIDIDPVVENVPTFKGKATAESKWETIKPSERTEKQQTQEEEEEDEREAEDERPQIVASSSTNVVVGGLQTAAEIRAKLASSRPTVPKREVSDDEPEEDTVYRDSKGKKIDTKQMRAEEKRRQARELEKKMKKMEWGKGLVQRQDRKTDAEELSKIASQPFARTIDDKDLNDELKGKQRWNDPAARFLTKSSDSTTKSTKPKYNGPPPPPNRYGIPPGFRWDGVDRSNGFEKKLFQTGNDQKRLRAEAYNYSVDEM
ncbi:uncharacterized protein PGTG_11236 [Puccinia graminis f. sp. tritici CRL 75-36-700-3]|uniref:Pre-mRNA-splicing factor CWC26 n=1 Tax=Puccinia graminis f. sp. tritici (strain CRL 75-36-700-3 / race SCCL) TaxID=418459 RepID=E3KL92_PUCGT|nr:uncharacterized protein PGTG_11236 [Puccinia graminis f. sp. tritici CRL 75-36-700-3]EFP85067.1 hypothetical protein PGTG_11236 [Puccinia graminis f. sp. tritici CRL 75-36-700-3]